MEKAGYVYALEVKVYGNFRLLKIGATALPLQTRWSTVPGERRIVYLSPKHVNYFENEATLHEHFAKWRVPRKAVSRGERGEPPEFFNMTADFFSENVPELFYKMKESPLNPTKSEQ